MCNLQIQRPASLQAKNHAEVFTMTMVDLQQVLKRAHCVLKQDRVVTFIGLQNISKLIADKTVTRNSDIFWYFNNREFVLIKYIE